MTSRTALAAIAGAVLALGPATSARADETARGVVFRDLDGDAVRDPGESGLADVRVSNGRDIVQTDAEGRYSLSVRPGDVLFVTKPAGFMTPVSADMLPRFYYIHQPEGSPPGLRYPGIAPTGPLPDPSTSRCGPARSPSASTRCSSPTPSPRPRRSSTGCATTWSRS